MGGSKGALESGTASCAHQRRPRYKLRSGLTQHRGPRMLVFWTSLLLLAVLPRHGEAQSCRPDLEGIALNLAEGRQACQSSIHPHEAIPRAGRAVDGNCSGAGESACASTEEQQDPWWYVDLGDRYDISSVVLKSRADCCAEGLQGATVHVGDAVPGQGKPNHLCGTVTDIGLGAISTFRCDWLRGRYVSVHLLGQAKQLTLCEVEAYGTKLAGQCGV